MKRILLCKELLAPVDPVESPSPDHNALLTELLSIPKLLVDLQSSLRSNRLSDHVISDIENKARYL